MSSNPVIEMQSVSFSYDGRPALVDVNLKINEYDSVCVVGPNGGGKTTLLRLVLGVIRPAEGVVRVLDGAPREKRLFVGYMPQHTQLDPQFPVSAMDVALMGRLSRHPFGPYSRADREAALSALDELGLADKARLPFSALSGGQRQRVLIARALACEPRLLLLDEPTANVDPHAEEQLLEILERLNKRMTVIMVTHDLGFVSQFFARVVCVNLRVVTHPTSEITGEIIQDIYGGDLRMVRHDHACSERGHNHV